MGFNSAFKGLISSVVTAVYISLDCIMLDIYVYINLSYFKKSSFFVLANSSGKAFVNLHAVPADGQMQTAAQYNSLPLFS